MRSLQEAIDAGKARGREALYFGAVNRPGHYLHDQRGSTIGGVRRMTGFPWTDAHLDGGLLHNGRHRDACDGKVYWTCGGREFWYAFFWWDRSCDSRGASNSGFYVRGFGWPEAQEAFDYAASIFPAIVKRQHFPLVLQDPMPPAARS